MSDFLCPAWLKQRGITDKEYGTWLQNQSKDIWRRERKKGKTAFATRAELKARLHQVALASSGRDPYSNIRFNVDPIRTGWTDAQAHLNNNRHHRTLRRSVPSFDHVRGLGFRAYELCTRETNSAKTYMSPAQFVELCHRVAKHRAPVAELEAEHGQTNPLASSATAAQICESAPQPTTAGG